MSEEFATIILAAGKGTRMRSRHPKVLHPLCGMPMLNHVVTCAAGAGSSSILVVIGHGAGVVQEVVAASGLGAECVVQEEQLGTGHAVLTCKANLADYAHPVLILNGDVPLVTPDLVLGVLAAHRKGGGGVTVVSVNLADPTGYGRIMRAADGTVERIVEQKDANAEERAVREVNTGIYVADADILFPTLEQVSANNVQGEYYLTDIVGLALAGGNPVHVHRADDPDLVLGVNSRRELARVGGVLRRRIHERLMDAGVTLVDPARTDVDASVVVGEDTVLYPGVTLQGTTVLGRDCVVLPGSRVVNSRIGDGVTIKDHCLIEDAVLEGGNSVGPMAHLRPGTVLRHGARIGNFVEIKKADIGEGSKINHLSYVGDASVGRDVNIGAGTITCNYDGVNKHHTDIGDGVFVGSDTQLVAPVKVGAHAVIGAGTTVTRDVPAGALAVSRPEQKNVDGWVGRRKTSKKKDGH
ncbi:MAG: bifunctional UDP-N-acetylglucosamine diphosphorylase/glucosamine-1-phosphate N-acetyltransferase GlmU [Nitrospirota bacterium]|nr:bifunctional UDP-N-acetylglucosamine diphosphorylase/glucosamine-1-phosphate N-acetyltransferase GlmU [Nitrospirota bacterium]